MAQTSGDKKRTPFCTAFPEGLAAGQQLKMEASLPKDCVSFIVNFLCGKEEKANSALLLLFALGDPNMVTLNNVLDKTFGKEEKHSNVPLAKGQHFDLIFIIEKQGYKVLINGEEFCQRKHYIPAEQVRFLQVEGDVDVKAIKLAGEKEKEVEEKDGKIKAQNRCMVMSISAISVYSQSNFRFLMQPLWFSSLVFCTGSLTLTLTALFTPYWVTESTPHGLLHGGLWRICLDPNCDFYPINLAWFAHTTRTFLVLGTICGLLAWCCISVSFIHIQVHSVSLILLSSIFSIAAGVLFFVGMCIFTYIYRNSRPYVQHLVLFGSSYGLAWACIPMFFITGALLMKTHRILDPGAAGCPTGLDHHQGELG